MKLINYLKHFDFVYWSLLVFSLFPLIPNKIKGISVILLFLFSLFNLKNDKVQWKDFIINSSLYLCFLVSFLMFKEKGESKQILETTLSILIIPIIFNLLIPNYKYDKKLIFNFMSLFIISTSIFAVIISLFIFFDTETYYYNDWYTNKARTLIEKVPYIGQHPIYGSIFSAISILFLLEIISFKRENWFKINVKNIIFLIINLLFLILLSSRGVIFSALFSILTFTFFRIKKIKYKFYLIILFSVVLTCLFQYNRRMKELLNFDTYLKVDSNFSNSYRFQSYKCGLNLLSNNIFFGYGVGGVQLKLNDCYKQNNLNLMVDKYNTHNQYLDILLKTGVFGLIIFFIFLFINISKAIYLRNNFILLTLIFYSIVFLTENILLRQSGVILFYFLVLFLNKFNFLSKKNNE